MPDSPDDDRTVAAQEVLAPIAVGSVVAGRWELLRLIGRGGMGSVYEAKDRELGESVALKLLDESAAARSSSEAVERFRREVRLARRVTHPNAARTYDLGEHLGVRFLTMELVDGHSLGALLQGGRRLSVGEGAAIGIQICEGLRAVHAAGVVHRDLKPDNVLLDSGGRVVLTDFGIARPVAGSDDGLETVGSIGTPAYMAPEQLTGGQIDRRADVYALGLVLYQMFTGELPFSGSTALAVAVARLDQEVEDPKSKADMPGDLALAILGCLEREPSARTPDVDSVAAVLELHAGPMPDSAALSPTRRTGASNRLVTSPHGSSNRTSFAPTSPGNRSVAVLPFRYRGPAEDDYLGESLSDELTDVLSRTRGLRVCASGSTRRFGEDRDPKHVGAELGVEAVVDGQVQRMGAQVRISARLIDTHDGMQRWSDRFDGRIEDVFELQDRMARRIAEALRVQLHTLGHEQVSAEAMECYLRARGEIRQHRYLEPDGALELLERSLALAPDFKPALAALAIARVRGWFVPSGSQEREAREQACRLAVEQANEKAPELAETHLAAGMWAVQWGRYAQAARSLAQALEIAPTFARAHEYLGRLQCEAGRGREGERHIKLALDLDESLRLAETELARQAELRGDRERADALIAGLSELDPRYPPLVGLRVRIAGWRGEKEKTEDILFEYGEHEDPGGAMVTIFGNAVTGKLPVEDVKKHLDLILESASSPRFHALALQIAIEVLLVVGETEQALELFPRAERSVLVDIDWLDRCPLIQPIKEDPRYAHCRTVVATRAESIWKV